MLTFEKFLGHTTQFMIGKYKNMKKGLFISLLAIISSVGNVFSQSMIISGGADHAVAICNKGTIYAWGKNDKGQLCLVDKTLGDAVSEPAKVKLDPNLTFSQVSAGSGGHNVALSCKSTVYCWGENDNGQCGRDKVQYGEVISDEPVPIYKGEVKQGYNLNGEATNDGEYLGGVVYVCGTTKASMAILSDRTAVWWGSNPLLGNQITTTPLYIRDSDNNILQNVVHIMGGDDNILIIVGNSPDDQVGTVYSAGDINGRGGVVDEYAKPVEIAKNEQGTISSGKFLENVRTTGICDVASYAVDGTTGYVYGWGDNGWGCSAIGSNPRGKLNYAAKVASGEYESISGQPYLTDVKQVIGGNGYGAAITEEGYMLWWGTNDAASTGNSGGVVPNSSYASIESTCETGGPVFANYCAGEKGPKEVRVDDAISIGRGDLVGFMVNSEGRYFVWGTTNVPGKNDHYGIMGTGLKKDLSTCLKEIKIPFEKPDICPEPFMNGPRYKCPGIKDSLYCGFTPVDEKRLNYFFRWTKDGKVMNDITENEIEKLRLLSKAELDSDPYNKNTIEIEEEGIYEVEVLYIGNNIPCDNCPEAKAKIEVIDMQMPIDTTITTFCVKPNPMNPTAFDDIVFKYTVNDKFYDATQTTTFAVFPTIDSNDTLGVFSAQGAGGVVDNIHIPGDKIIEINDNTKDTTYTVWIEDITRFETKLFEETTIPTTGYINSNQGYAQIIHLTSTSELQSISFFVMSSSNGDADFTVTPKIYKAGKIEYGQYTAGEEFWTGKSQPFTATSDAKEIEVKCNIVLPANEIRGTDYILIAEPTKKGTGDVYWYAKEVASAQALEYPTPYEDSEKTGILATGAIAQFKPAPEKCNGGQYNQYFNITFGKMTDYTCGRIMLTSKLDCPPCNDPKELEITASETIKNDVDADYKKVVELCKESDELVLDIEPLEGKSDPTATFDIFWFDKYTKDESEALTKDDTGNATTLEWKTDWATVAGAADIEKAVEKVYYVMVYDHKNPKDCIHYDSIKVIAHPAPTDSLEWMEFCEGSLATEPTFEIADMTINWIDEPKNVVDLTGPATGTGTKEYTYKYTVVDDKTGCESVEHTLTISVNKTGKPDVTTPISLLKDPTTKFNLSAAVGAGGAEPDCEILWYESETATSEMTNTSIALDKADTIRVWAEQYNTVTKCTSERVMVEIIINDAPVPEVTNESLCLDNEIPDLSEYVKAKDSDHTLNWYDDPTAAKGTGSTTAPSFKATAAGTYKFYVSQTNTKTDAESEKATLTITVHEVATLELSANKTKYCINEPAEELTFKASDGDFTTAKWSKKSDMTDATASLTPTTDEKGDLTYYAQAEYTNKDAQKSYASTVCYGKIQDITITTNKTEIPNSETNYTVQYLKAEGDKNQSYKSLLDQDGTAVKVDAGHSLKWYDSDKNPLASEPAPEYIANETGERKVTYYVSQVNQSTGCESELHDVTAIISSFPAPEVKAITLCEGSEKLKSSFPLTAKISTKGGFSESDYELIWYKEDPKSNPSAEEFSSIDLSQENLSYDSSTETEKDFKYWVVQRYIGPGGGQSPASELLVTIYSKPILITKTPAPICLGGEVDLKDLYSISNRISNQDYELEYFGTSGDVVKTSKATEHGRYKSRAWFTLSSGEVCASTFKDVFVTVHELKVAITGDNTTCPGIGVELTAVVDPKNMDNNEVASYSWVVSPTGVTGQMEKLNTSAEGLEKKGDKIIVNLEVSMGACKGKKPVDAHIVTVDDPGVDGTIKFDEQYNTNSGQGTYTLSKNGIVEFDGCNSKVDVLFNVQQTENEFTYENLETGVKKTGTFNNGEGQFDIKAGLYEVSYTNTCATSFKFEVKDRSLDISGSPSSWSVCEGTPLTIKIVNNDNTPFEYDPRKYKIEWQKDGNALPGYDTEVLYIPSTTPDDNGVYSYTVTSSGCVYHDKIAMGGSFTSKPKVKIDESLLPKDGVYEAVRTTAKDITIPIIQSTGIDMAKLSNKIVWNEDGNEVNKGETLSLARVDSDHEYQVVIANGEKGYDTEFCGTSLNIILKADALLSIEAILIDAEGKQTKDMCLNEEGTGFKIDTTGTGRILHPDKFTFKIVETIDGVKKDIKWAKKDDYLFAEISPNKSAKYDIVYKYEVGNQDSSKTSEITVHPAYEVDWDRDVRICEGGTGFIQITKAEPASEIELSWEFDECLINGSKSGANVEAIFSGSGLVTKKALTLVASNGGICADKKYYPEFTIDKAIEGNIIAPEFVCEGHTATLDASPFKATEYIWSSIDQFGENETMSGASINVVSKPGYASYTVEMKRGVCTETADATIEVRYAPRFDRIDSLSFRSVEIVLQSNTGTAPFQYIVDDNYDENVDEPVKDNLEYGNHSVKVIDAAGCQIDSSFVTHAPGLEFPIHISPNGDGKDDVFSIPVLRDAYPDANIRIFDRWGKKLADYKAGNTEMDWDGTYNGVQMPSTDYWYEIEIKEIKKTYTGHFTLIRQ